MEKILTDGLRFTDKNGNTRLFNGMNIDDKLIGNVFRYDLNEEFFEKYTACGFNLIRLAVQWANIEPEPGKYSESYLGSLDEIFRLAEKYGVYILLDMHQDLYSGFGGTGGGDGAPDWACMMDGHKAKPYKFVWAEAYVFGKWVHSCFDHFWNNDTIEGKGLQEHYADLWRMLAKRYGNSPALFGYDLMNEPAPGSYGKKMFFRLLSSGLRQITTSRKISRTDIISALIKRDYKKLLDSIPGAVIRDIVGKVDKLSAEFDLKYYSPFINKISSAIREVTPDGIILIEQPYLCNGGVRLAVPPITVNGKREPLQCFGPHAYDMTVDTPLYKYANADRVKAFFSEMRNSQLRLDVPAVVGEWGGCSNNKDTSWFPHAFELLDFFDSNQWGQLYWDYHGDDLDSPLIKMLSRTYPVSVPGKIISYGTDRENGIFRLEYECKESGQAVIYVHKKAEADFSEIQEYRTGASLMKFDAKPGINKIKIRF